MRGRAFFSHKTRKQLFSNVVHYVLIMQLALITFAAWVMG